jgi:hypothetical protein
MVNEHIQLTEASGIKQQVEPLPCCELASLVLLLDLLRTATGPLLVLPALQFLKAIENRCHQASPFPA